MSNTNSTTIERLQCRYLVPSEHPAPEEVRTRLDGVAHTYLVDVCGRWLAQFLPPDDPSVWLIHQLNIDLSADIGSMDNSELAEIWGRQIALSIIQAVAVRAEEADKSTDDMIKHYRNKAVYMAHFIADLAEGRAWGKWYYRHFDAVSSLSTSAAIRTVMTREPELIAEILVHLATQKRLEPVLQCLSEHDARSIYAQGIPAGSVESADAGSSSLIELALSVWASAVLELSSKRLATPHNALRLYTAIWKRSATHDADRVRHTIDHLLRLAEVLRGVSQPAKLVAHLIADELTEALQLLRSAGMMPYLESLSFLQQVALGDEALIRRVMTTIATSVALEKFDAAQNLGRAGTTSTTGTTVQSFTTLIGGIFLLLPSFLDLKLYELIETAPYPDPEEEQVAPVLRYLLFLKCFGLLYNRWSGIAHDPALLLLAGLEEAPSSDRLLHLCQLATGAMNDACQQGLLERLARYKHLEGRYLYVELIEGAANDSILLIRDMKHDSWVYARYLSAETHSISAIWGMLMHGMTLLQKTVAMDPEYLVLGPGFEKLTSLEEFVTLYQAPIQLVWTRPIQFSGAIPHQQGSAGGSENQEDAITLWTRTHALPQEVQVMFMRYLKRVQPASRDLDYLTLNVQHEDPQPLIDNRDIDLAWSLLARALMRAFARRLIGFDQSSMPYLYQNFLAGTSTVHVQQDLVEVRLPCSPLHTILRMAGVNGQSYALPWLNNSQVTLELTC